MKFCHFIISALFGLTTAVESQATVAPLLKAEADGIPGRYIVKLKSGNSLLTSNEVIFKHMSKADQVYRNLFNGFATSLVDAELASLRLNPSVEYIEQDTRMKALGYVDQPNAGWNLGRISHRKPGNSTYTYDDSAGAGTCCYILDTGIAANHPEFSGRAAQIKSLVSQTTDGNGHGTHIAGVIGGVIHGVAKRTRLYGVKVLDDNGSGTLANVIAGMDYIAKDAKTRGCPRGAMANLSIGGSFSKAVNDAAAALVRAGVFVSVAAGGSNGDVSRTSPASEPTVCTVGASTERDARAAFSDYGALLDIFAPGVNIVSTWLNGNTQTLSGTSMAAAHITGLGAYLAGLGGFPGAEALYVALSAGRHLDLNLTSGQKRVGSPVRFDSSRIVRVAMPLHDVAGQQLPQDADAAPCCLGGRWAIGNDGGRGEQIVAEARVVIGSWWPVISGFPGVLPDGGASGAGFQHRICVFARHHLPHPAQIRPSISPPSTHTSHHSTSSRLPRRRHPASASAPIQPLPSCCDRRCHSPPPPPSPPSHPSSALLYQTKSHTTMPTAPLKCTEVATGDALAKQIADIIDVEVKDATSTAQATSDEDTANNIDKLFQKSLAADPASAEDFLYTLWDVVLKSVGTIPATDHRLHNLIAVIEALKKKDTAEVEIWGEKTHVWKNLPMLGPALREAWNFKPDFEDKDEKKDKVALQKWISLNSFAARIFGRKIQSSFNLGLWELRAGLEEKHPSEASRDLHLNTASEWLYHAGDELWRISNAAATLGQDEVDVTATGSLVEESSAAAKGPSRERWTFWKKRLRELTSEMSHATKEEGLKERVDGVINKMNTIEKGKK
ncbi:hypothetical protein PWT90_10664 [Aphanocladium album]|nr:hypothetical protein PWT90_10664 [Aphanocladium album]